MSLLQGNELFVLYLIKSETIQTLGQFDVVQVNDIAHGPLVLPCAPSVPLINVCCLLLLAPGIKELHTICWLLVIVCIVLYTECLYLIHIRYKCTVYVFKK